MKNAKIQDKLVDSNRVLYTPSTFAKNTLLYLQETGTLQALSSHTSKRSRLSSFLFFCVKTGSGTLSYEGRTYILSAGDCVFIDCNKPYSHYTSEDLWCLQWVHFDGPNMDKIHQKFIAENAVPFYHPSYITSYEKLLNELRELTTLTTNVRDILISEKLMGLLAQIMNDCEQRNMTKNDTPKSAILSDVRNYLETNFKEKISLDDLSAIFYIDKYYLTRRFKQYYGTTINTYLQQLKITHAKQLLRFSDFSIEEIASQCGIDDPNYFARLFKKIEGMAPGEFRRSWKGSGK